MEYEHKRKSLTNDSNSHYRPVELKTDRLGGDEDGKFAEGPICYFSDPCGISRDGSVCSEFGANRPQRRICPPRRNPPDPWPRNLPLQRPEHRMARPGSL